ncbi:MAG: hypothetical protein ACTIJ9_10030 [Aequorivita sp.]
MKERNPHSPKKSLTKRQVQDTKEKEVKQLYKILYKKPISRRMAATELGYTDQTYMVTQNILDMIESGRAQVVGRIKCERSQNFVEAVTTNPAYFRSRNDNSLKTFE